MSESKLFPPHLDSIIANMKEVDRLSEIHEQVSGVNAGHKFGVEVLNKSAIVLLVACWESYVEELARISFEVLMDRADTHDIFPSKFLTMASSSRRKSENETLVWQLAGDGWRKVLTEHKDKMLSQHVDSFRNPSASNIDDLFHSVIGLKAVSKDWHWHKVNATQASEKLNRLIVLRGQIAHSVITDSRVRKSLVNNYSHFIKRLAAMLSNSVTSYINDRCGYKPWILVNYVGHKN